MLSVPWSGPGVTLPHGPHTAPWSHTGPVQPPASCSHLPLQVEAAGGGGGEVLRPAEVLLQAVLPAPGMPLQDTGTWDTGEMTW